MTDGYVTVLLTDEFGDEVQIKSLKLLPAIKMAKFADAGAKGDVGAIIQIAIDSASSPKDITKIENLTMEELTTFLKNWIEESGFKND